MLQVFYLDVAYVLQCFFKCFTGALQVFQKNVSSVSYVLRLMLQILYLDVLKVDRVLHIGTHVGSGRDTSGPRAQSGGCPRRRPASASECSTLETECSAGVHPDVDTLALMFLYNRQLDLMLDLFQNKIIVLHLQKKIS